MDRDKLADELYENLRDIDRRELGAFWASGLEMLVILPIRLSKELYVKRDTSGRLLLVAGVQVLQGEYGGVIWQLGTKYLDQYPQKNSLLCKEMRDVKDGWLKEYKYLSNYVYEGSKESIRWITYLGAEWGDTIESNGNKFIHFCFKGE